MYPDQQQVILKPIGSSPATTVEETPEVASNPIKRTKTLSDLMNKMKDGLIDLFKEEGDNHL